MSFMSKIFKSKAQKKQERELLIKKSMRDMEARIKKLKAQESVYIESAKVAIREELPAQIKLAKDALKMTMAEEKRTYQMLLNARIISQMKDMSEMTGEFLQSVKVISKSIMGNMNTDMGQISADLRTAIESVRIQTENLETMMDDSQEEVSEFSEDTKLISDEMVEQKIYGVGKEQASASGSITDKEIADELKNMESLLNK